MRSVSSDLSAKAGAAVTRLSAVPIIRVLSVMFILSVGVTVGLYFCLLFLYTN